MTEDTSCSAPFSRLKLTLYSSFPIISGIV